MQHPGHVLVLGCGSVSQCTVPLLVEMMQRNWLIGGGGPKPPPASDKISADRVGGGR